MAKTAHDTEIAVRKAMLIYTEMVLNPSKYDSNRGIYVYKPRISESDIREIAKIKSRSTLLSHQHSALKKELDGLIADLKIKTGKARPVRDDGSSTGRPTSEIARSERLAQTVAALSFRIMVLESELKDLRSGQSPKVSTFAATVQRAATK